MKILLVESKLKKLLSDRFGLDLTGKITMVTNQYQLPILLDTVITPTQLNRILNNQGPCYLVEFKNQYYLLTPFRNDDWLVIMRYGWLNPFEFMKELGIEVLGLSIDDLLNLYFDEKKSMNESYNSDDEPDYKILNRVINKSMSKRFDWWKELTIYDLKIAQSRFREGYYYIEGKLRVDHDWGASQWRKYHYSGPFPGNSAWDDKNDYSYIYFGDMIGGEEADEVRQKLLTILNSFYLKTFKDVRLSAMKLYFDEKKSLNESDEEKLNNEFKWVSEEVEKLYKLTNKTYTTIMKKRFPYIRRIEVNKRDFNNVFADNENDFFHDVDVEMCADWFSDEYNNEKQIEKEKKKGGIGSVMGDLWKDVLLLTGNKLLENKRIFVKLILNKTSFCKGYLKHTIDE